MGSWRVSQAFLKHLRSLISKGTSAISISLVVQGARPQGAACLKQGGPAPFAAEDVPPEAALTAAMQSDHLQLGWVSLGVAAHEDTLAGQEHLLVLHRAPGTR